MIDQAIVAFYLLITLAIGLYVGRDVKSINEFAVGRRNFPTLVLVAAVFASVVDASCTVGLAGNTFAVGAVLIVSYMGVTISRLILAYYIAPKMDPFLGLISSGDIFEKIYGKKAKTLMGFSSLIECILTAGTQVLATSQMMQYFYGVPSELAIIGGALVVIFYSFRGGIRSVTATEVFQFGVIVVAIPIICGIGIFEIGGYSKLIDLIGTHGLYFSKPAVNDYGKHLALFLSMALPCLYPMCLQRMLMAKNTKQIKKTFLISGIISFPFYIAIGLIGLIAFILLPDINPNDAFPALINHMLPIGARGIVIAGLFAIFMSTADSIFNVGAIALTHDVVGSLTTKKLTGSTQLNLAKLSSLAIAIGSIIIALRFNNVLDVLFLMMVTSNSIFFPGYFIGITSKYASTKGFWSGVVAGFLIVILGYFILKMYPLYVMLLAITTNSIVHLLVSYFTKNITKEIRHKKIILQKAIKNSWIKNTDYCNIFAVCTLGLSLFPYFLNKQSIDDIGTTFLALNAIIAISSFAILFREQWWAPLERYSQILWGATLILALPCQSFFLLYHSHFDPIWIVDCFVILLLLVTLTSKRVLGFIYAWAFLICSLLCLFFSPSPQAFASEFAYWCLILHVMVLALCLALFRKRDVEMCRSAGSALVHEATRSMDIFDTVTQYYNKRLPELIYIYKSTPLDVKKNISLNELDNMLTIPNDLREINQRTKNVIKKLYAQVSHYAADENLYKEISIRECVLIALKYPFVEDKLKNLVSLEISNDLEILGDKDQLVQVFINLLENSVHALKEIKLPKVIIKITGQSIYIRDNGHGISERDLPNIFDEFFSTKATLGEGLAFCRRIIKDHGGSITCDSQKGSFTEFELRFPSLN